MFENCLLVFLKFKLNLFWISPLKTNIRDERVCSTETSFTALTPELSSPHCVARWGVGGFENLNCRCGPRSPFACPLHPPHPHSAKHGKGSAYCSANLRDADYDHPWVDFYQTWYRGAQMSGFNRIVLAFACYHVFESILHFNLM